MIKAETALIREDSLEKEAVDSSQLAECMMERGGGRTSPAGLVLGLYRPVEGQGFGTQPDPDSISTENQPS